jgi:hypothetical protein
MLLYVYGAYLLVGAVMFIFNFPEFDNSSGQSEIELTKIKS